MLAKNSPNLKPFIRTKSIRNIKAIPIISFGNFIFCVYLLGHEKSGAACACRFSIFPIYEKNF